LWQGSTVSKSREMARLLDDMEKSRELARLLDYMEKSRALRYRGIRH
jgi:hypothetical protein